MASTYSEYLQGLEVVRQKRQKNLDAASGSTQRQALNTIALLGDSITAVTTETNGVFTSRSSRGFYTWAMQRLGYRLRLVSRTGTNTGGVSSNTTAAMLARLQADILDLKPGYVHVLAGVNDIMGVLPRATTIQNLTDIYDRIEAAGSRLILGTITPLGNPRTDAMRDNLEAINQWIREQARTRPGVILVDYHAALAGADGQWRATGNAWSHDGIHPATGGAMRMGEALADALRPFVPAAPFLPSSNRDSSLAIATSTVPNLITNPMMTGTTGALGTSGATGQLATSWSLTSYQGGGSTTAATLSKVNRTDDQPGVWQQITSTATTAQVRVQQDFNTSANLQPGDRLVGSIEYELQDVTALALVRVQLLSYDANAGWANRGTVADPAMESADASTIPFSKLPAKGVLHTPPLTYASNATGLNFAIDFGAVGTIRVCRASLRRYRSA